MRDGAGLLSNLVVVVAIDELGVLGCAGGIKESEGVEERRPRQYLYHRRLALAGKQGQAQ